MSPWGLNFRWALYLGGGIILGFLQPCARSADGNVFSLTTSTSVRFRSFPRRRDAPARRTARAAHNNGPGRAPFRAEAGGDAGPHEGRGPRGTLRRGEGRPEADDDWHGGPAAQGCPPPLPWRLEQGPGRLRIPAAPLQRLWCRPTAYYPVWPQMA